MKWLGAAGTVLVVGAAWWRLGAVRYVALGDSLAAGVGSVLFFGYPHRFRLLAARRLRRPVLLTNLGRFGWTSGDLLSALRTDPRLRRAVAGATLITVDIGGNDLRRCGQDDACLQAALAAFRANWAAIWAEVRALNPTAVCLALQLYNPYPAGHPERGRAEAWLTALNAAMADPALAARHGFACADGHTPFQGRECRYTWLCLLGDIHPTDPGHAALAAAVDQAFAPLARPGWWLARWLGHLAFPLWARRQPWPGLEIDGG